MGFLASVLAQGPVVRAQEGVETFLLPPSSLRRDLSPNLSRQNLFRLPRIVPRDHGPGHIRVRHILGMIWSPSLYCSKKQRDPPGRGRKDVAHFPRLTI